MGRLSSAGEYKGDDLHQTYLLNYDYDVYGNRYQKSSRNTNNPVSQVWVEDGAYDQTTNRFNSGVTYDDSGNVTLDSRFRSRSFRYDANDRQRQSSALDGTAVVQSVYDGAGHRVAVKAGGQITNVMVYDMAGELVAEYGGSVSDNGTRYVMGDQQGTPRVVMTSAPVNGQIVAARHDYLPFGEDVPGSVGMRAGVAGYDQGVGVRQKYAGMEGDDSTGMSHTQWREYDNLSARWTAPDPYGGSMSLASPQTFNRYAYVNNDPVNKVDPTGLMLSDIGVFQTDNEGLAQRLETDTVMYFERYMAGQTGRAQQQYADEHNYIIEGAQGGAAVQPQSGSNETSASAQSTDGDSRILLDQNFLKFISDNNFAALPDELLFCQIAAEAHEPGDPINVVNPRAHGNPSFRGLMQVSPEAAFEVGWGNKLGGGKGDEAVAKVNPTYMNTVYDPAQNIRMGSKYLRLRVERAGENLSKGLEGYRKGVGTAAGIAYRTSLIGDAKHEGCEQKVRRGDIIGGLRVIYPTGPAVGP